MSFPLAAGFAMSLISLILFVISLSSSTFGIPFSATGFITTVCSTEPGNNTYVSYNVSKYNETKLVLNCPGEAGRSVYWTRADGSVPLCTSRNCTVNSNRRLTNDDSGDYLCETSVENGTDYQFVHINVLGPPQLHNVVSCVGKELDKCTLGQNPNIFTNTKYHINVSFTAGNGPFHVIWYHNGTEFTCNTFSFCDNIEHGSTYQTLYLRTYNFIDTMLMSGLYRAAVSNPYGTNESAIRLKYSCKPPTNVAYTLPEITVDLQEGSVLNKSCGITVNSAQQMYACVTKNSSATFADVYANDSHSCVTCSGAAECLPQFNSSVTNITVSRSEELDGCPPVQLMNFVKSEVTVKDDDGLKIICAYRLGTYDELEEYTSIHVRVSHSKSPNNHSRQVSVTVSVCLVGTLVAALIITSCVIAVLRKRKHQRHNGNGSVVIQDETSRLLRPDDHGPGEQPEPIEPLQYDDYGTMSVLEVFPHELGPQEPVQNVQIPASSAVELGSEGHDTNS